MITSRKDISLSFVTIFLIVCMGLPSLLKLSHALTEHRDIQCSENISLHLHEAEFDCEFQKYKLTHQTYPTLEKIELLILADEATLLFSRYNYLNSHQQLHFSLRGPPQIS